jgi:predicted hydrocarbon binding protein
MKGIVFNLLEKFVENKFGLETWEQIESGAELKTKELFIGPGTYDDEELLALVGSSNKVLSLSINTILKSFGRFCFRPMIETNKSYLDGINNAAEFLHIVDNLIHVEVKKLMPDAYLPKIEVRTVDHKVFLKYHSKRKLCSFLEGLVTGCADYCNENVDIQHPVCMHNGSESCELILEFTPKD